MRLFSILVLASVGSVAGQQGPTVLTSATGQVDVPPDFAVVTVGATFSESTATTAAAALTRTLNAILDTLSVMGFARDSLPTVDFAVQPRIDYQTNSLVGYDARVSVEVTVRDLDRAGPVIDAAMSAGANQIGALDFRLEDHRTARDSALALAVSAARRDAEVLAAAVGGRIGSLMEITTVQRPDLGAALALDAVVVNRAPPQRSPLAVTPRSVTVTVHVRASWQFVRN